MTRVVTMWNRRLFVSFILLFLIKQSTAENTDGQPKFEFKFFDKNFTLMDEKDLKNADNNKSLIAYLHGFKTSIRQGDNVEFGKSLARSTDSNVVMVDWSDWTLKKDYMVLVELLPTLALRLVDWLNGLQDRGTVKSFDDVTLIGHSLGAQLIGYVGHRLNGTIKRIIALDPAQPIFSGPLKKERVNKKSGKFVMVLHSSTVFLGLREPVGHADFYFNGGRLQPSCLLDTLCGHIIVLYYFAESVNNSSDYEAFRCHTLEDCEKNIVDRNEQSVNLSIDMPNTTAGLYSVTVPVKTEFQKRYKKFEIYNAIKSSL